MRESCNQLLYSCFLSSYHNFSDFLSFPFCLVYFHLISFPLIYFMYIFSPSSPLVFCTCLMSLPMYFPLLPFYFFKLYPLLYSHFSPLFSVTSFSSFKFMSSSLASFSFPVVSSAHSVSCQPLSSSKFRFLFFPCFLSFHLLSTSALGFLSFAFLLLAIFVPFL